MTNAGINLPSPCVISPLTLAPGNYGIAIVHNGVGPAYTNGNGTSVPGSGTNQTFTAVELTVLAGASAGGGLGTAICCTPRIINMTMYWTTGSGTVATRTSYGAGCYDTAGTFYELFSTGTFDLAGASASTPNSIVLQPASGGYIVLPGSNTWFTPVSANLGLFDDSVSAPQALPVPLTTPVGTTTQVWISSNGFLWTAANTNNGCCNGDPAILRQLPERFAPFWQDLNPGAGGTVHFDVVGNDAFVTWLNVPEFGQTNTNSVQVAILASGAVEYRWLAGCNNVSHSLLVGYSPGNNARSVPAVDLSTALPLVVGPERDAIALAASARPVVGTSLNLVTSEIPAGTAIGATILSFTQFNPGLDLTGLGMPGCSQYVGLDSSLLFVVSGTTGTTGLSVPNTPSLAGLHVYAQSATFSGGFNALGVLSSNGLDLGVGTL